MLKRHTGVNECHNICLSNGWHLQSTCQFYVFLVLWVFAAQTPDNFNSTYQLLNYKSSQQRQADTGRCTNLCARPDLNSDSLRHKNGVFTLLLALFSATNNENGWSSVLIACCLSDWHNNWIFLILLVLYNILYDHHDTMYMIRYKLEI